jgi:GMP synthase (glutamine-hydrolysing)
MVISGQESQEGLAFDAEGFVGEKVREIRNFVGDGRAAIATSGGVDSTACAALAHRALGDRLICFFVDTGFMREGETGEVEAMLKGLGLPLRVLSARERFLRDLEGKSDAEAKRLAFRQTFYTILGEAAREEGCSVLVQGTIAPDWIETSGGIKTQHNVLEQLGVDTKRSFGFRLLEPLMDLYKDQVRALARHLGADVAAAERQPFPGPGLLVRCIGAVSAEKIGVLKMATSVVEGDLAKARPEPKQYLAAVIEDARSAAPQEVSDAVRGYGERVRVEYLEGFATGVKGDNRAYGKLAVVSCKGEPEELFGLPEKVIHADGEVVRVLLNVGEAAGRKGGGGKGHAVIIRAVETRDFMTAKPSAIPLAGLSRIAEQILRDERVSIVCYDLTSKPPATVEFE